MIFKKIVGGVSFCLDNFCKIKSDSPSPKNKGYRNDQVHPNKMADHGSCGKKSIPFFYFVEIYTSYIFMIYYSSVCFFVLVKGMFSQASYFGESLNHGMPIVMEIQGYPPNAILPQGIRP